VSIRACQAVRAASGTAAAGTAPGLAGDSSGRPRTGTGSSRPGNLLPVLGQVIADLVFQVPLQRTSLAETPGGDHRCGITCLSHVGRASRREQSAQIQLILRPALAGGEQLHGDEVTDAGHRGSAARQHLGAFSVLNDEILDAEASKQQINVYLRVFWNHMEQADHWQAAHRAYQRLDLPSACCHRPQWYGGRGCR
jgi:hypothetical protein